MRRTASLLLFLCFCVQTARPCSCSSANAVCSVYWDTQLLFRGRVIDIKFVPDETPRQVTLGGKNTTVIGPGRIDVHFLVTENLRGDAGAEVVIHTPSQGSACGVEFQRDTEYLVYSYRQANGEWWTSKCTRTHEVTNAEQDADLLWMHGLKTAPPGSTIFGTVTQILPDLENNGYKSQPLEAITVRVRGPETRTVKTDNEGKFSTAGLPNGKYEVSPEYPDGLGPSTPWTVSARDRACAEVQFRPQTDGVVDGNILNADLTSASGLYIRLKRVEESQASRWTQDLYVATTDSDGHFHFEPVQPGSYVLGVNIDFPAAGSPFHHKNFYPGTASKEQAEIIHIAGAQHISGLRYILPPEPARKNMPVRIRVVLPNGAPASNPSIELWNPQWPDYYWGPEARKDADGWYSIELPEGELYNLFVRVDDSDGQYPCAGPKAVVANANMQSMVLVLTGSQGSCFDRHITEPPQQ